MIRRWDPILLECGGISSWARGVTLATRWLYETQPITSGWSWAFPIGRGGIHWGDNFFRARVVGGVEIWKCFTIKGWDFVLPGCGGTSTLPRGETLAARRLHEPEPINNQWMRMGFTHHSRWYQPGGSLLSSPDCWSFK